VSVAALVVTHGGGPLLARCLDSLAAQQPAELVVVDSATPGGAPAEARRDGVRLIELPENRGFAAAVNAGVAATTAPLIALLNPDACAAPGWLAALTGAAAAHPEHAWFASRVLTDEGRIDSAGHTLSLTGRGVKVGEGEPDGPAFDAPREVLGAPASAALYRRAALDVAGPFDESLHLVMEDLEWDLRARAHGLRCLYVPAARATHAVSAFRGRGSDASVYLEDRNTALVLARHVPARMLPRMALPWLAHQAWSLVVKTRRGQLGPWCAARKDALLRLPSILRERWKSSLVQVETLDELLDKDWHRRRASVFRKNRQPATGNRHPATGN
jgi:GT2 family glycosyltransferase